MSSRTPRVPWSDVEIEFLVRLYPHVRTEALVQVFERPLTSIYHKAGQLGLRKSEAFLASPAACRLRRGDEVGKASRFKPGQTPWNKGSHYVAGGRSAETRFRPGQKPHTWRPIGHTRVTKDGYLQRKVADTGCTRRDYVGIHHLVWRMHGRSVPHGHALVFVDGDKTHIDINNLELIPRAELMRRNTVHNLPPELKEVVDLKRRLSWQLTNLEKRAHGE